MNYFSARSIPCLASLTLAALGLMSTQANAANFVVTNAADNGAGSLRQAISDANNTPGYDTIGFDSSVFSTSQIIPVVSGPLDINDNLSIEGPQNGAVVLSAYMQSRLFNINGGSVKMSFVTLKDGQTSDPRGGGAILNDGLLELVHVSLENNLSTTHGGGVMNNKTLSLDYVTLLKNTAQNRGGGIYNAGKLVAQRSTFRENGSYYGGGGIANVGSGFFTIHKSVFFGNGTGNGLGGGILSEAGTNIVTNSTLAYNGAVSGGGIANMGGVLRLMNDTIVENRASFAGGVKAENAKTIVGHTIIDSENYSSVDFTGPVNPFVSEGYNLIGNGNALSAFNQVGDRTNVSLGALRLTNIQDNGGPTWTMMPQNGSIAIDAGNPRFYVGVNDTDQRERPRISNGRIDIGAVEYQVALGAHLRVRTLQNTPVEFDLAASSDNNNPQIVITQMPRAGQLESLGGTRFRYTPTPYATGSFAISYKVTNGESEGSAAYQESPIYSIVVFVDPNPALLIAQWQVVQGVQNADVYIRLSATGGTGDPTYHIVLPPRAGTLTKISNAEYIFTPPANRGGSFCFAFNATDNTPQTSNTSYVTVRIPDYK